MRILYLYAEVMGYTMATVKALVDRGAEVHIVHWDKRKLTPYVPPKVANVHFYNRSEMSRRALLELADQLSPDVTVVSGWMDATYLAVARTLRARRKPVVSGFDGQWHGTLRQRAAALLGAMGYFTRHFSHAWVAGPCQFEFARRIGFDKRNIVFDLYSADLGLFQGAAKRRETQETDGYPHRFLFVGRLEPVKGLDTLVQAWQSLGEQRKDWELCLIGSGSMGAELRATPGIVVKDFMQPEQLLGEVEQAGCFVLPSRGEPWGVVVHEFAAAGLPLIISDVVGAAHSFLISGANGFSFKANDSESLAERMQAIIDLPNDGLSAMGELSARLAAKITPESSAANLLSAVA